MAYNTATESTMYIILMIGFAGAQLLDDIVAPRRQHLRGESILSHRKLAVWEPMDNESQHSSEDGHGNRLHSFDNDNFNNLDLGDNSQQQQSTKDENGNRLDNFFDNEPLNFDYLDLGFLSSSEPTANQMSQSQPSKRPSGSDSLLSSNTDLPISLPSSESSSIAYSYVSKYEPILDTIDHWCLDKDNNDCQCENPLEPTSKQTISKWDERHNENVKVAQEAASIDDAELDVVFIGDSITEQRQGTEIGDPVEKYDEIKEEFDKAFTKSEGGDFDGIALGISGDTSSNLLWRLVNGEMPNGLAPKVWWIGIGINDLLAHKCSEKLVILGIFRIVEEIQRIHPRATIVINSILPVQHNVDGKLYEDSSQDAYCKRRMCMNMWPSIVAINEKLSKFASNQSRVEFFDADNIFIQDRADDGKYLKLSYMYDPVHPNVRGHGRLNVWITKMLHEILGDEE